MKKDLPDFMIDATNIYRTKKYIVKQNLYIDYDINNSSILFSQDIYYLRNKKIDKLFDLIFERPDLISGLSYIFYSFKFVYFY